MAMTVIAIFALWWVARERVTPSAAVVAIPTPTGAPSAAPAPADADAVAETSARPSAVRSAPTPAADADGDGVPDELDRCPSELENARAGEPRDGCPDRVVLIYTNPPPPVVIHFGAGSASIQPSAAPLLDEPAATTGHRDLCWSRRGTDTSASTADAAISPPPRRGGRGGARRPRRDAARLAPAACLCSLAPNDSATNRGRTDACASCWWTAEGPTERARLRAAAAVR
jgi:hypothetical protein